MLEEITVTSRRYEESVQDVPVSVSAMTSDFLEDQGINDVRNIIEMAPGGAYTGFNKMQQEYSLRGVSSQTEGSSGDSSVVTVIDNVVISREFMKSQAFFDMERVEILRGPQGTSFGRNATSGMVHLITARPEHESSARIILDVGDYDTYGVEGYVTGSLSENTAGRLAVNFDTRSGYTTDIDAGPSDAGVPDSSFGGDLGAEQNFAIRGSLLFSPNDDIKVFVKAEYNKDDDDNPAPRKGLDCTIPYQADFPVPSIVGAPQPGWTQYTFWHDSCDPYETTVSNQTYLGKHFLEREIISLAAEVTWSINDDLTLTSVTGYLEGDSDYLIELHGGPNNSAWQSTQNDAWQFSQEFRLDNHASGNQLRWLGGLYFLTDDQTRDDANIFYVDNSVGDPQSPTGFRPEGRDIKQQNNETDSIGIFGELSFDISDQLNATVGVRWSADDKNYSVAHYGWGWGGPIDTLTDGIDADNDGIPDEQCAFGPGGPPDWGLRFCGSPENPVGFVTPVPAKADWDNVSFKGSLSYAFTDDHMGYFLVSEGYKTGGFQNEPFNPTDALVPFNEETVINYEVGFKGTFNDRVRINLSVFRSDYDDLQLFLFKTSPTGDYNQVTENAANAEIEGIELEWVVQATDYLRFSGSYARLNAKFVDTLIDTDGDAIPEDYSGTRPENSPKWTATAVMEYNWPLANGSSMSLRADYRGTGNFYDGIGEPANRNHAGFDVVGVRGTWYSADDKWRVSIWSKNVLDELYTINVGPDQPNINQLNFEYGPPRTFGATVSYSF
ncbi:MAG: TonB-dependent receptor [Xanthomonadales bacterium]